MLLEELSRVQPSLWFSFPAAGRGLGSKAALESGGQEGSRDPEEWSSVQAGGLEPGHARGFGLSGERRKAWGQRVAAARAGPAAHRDSGKGCHQGALLEPRCGRWW